MRPTLVRSISIALGAGLLLAALGFTSADEEDLWVPVGFVILRSTSDYAEAKRVAEEAARRLEIPLNLRGLVHDAEHGLTWPKEVCAKGPLFPFPCYMARGRFDEGVYLSVELSDAYATFRPGLFIVIAASGVPGSSELAATLESARHEYPDAYLKQEKVYQGCIH